jgi:hypothetical protein
MAVLVRFVFAFFKSQDLNFITKPRLSSTRATLVALICSFFEVFDVPVYWPILVMYFFTLFALTMRRQIQ